MKLTFYFDDGSTLTAEDKSNDSSFIDYMTQQPSKMEWLLFGEHLVNLKKVKHIRESK